MFQLLTNSNTNTGDETTSLIMIIVLIGVFVAYMVYSNRQQKKRQKETQDTLATVFFVEVLRIFSYIPPENGLTQAFHKLMQEGDIVQTQKHCAVHLPSVNHVTKIRFRVVATAITVTFLI